MRGDTLILFARAPRLGTVKRRLARDIGPVAALRFHRGQVARLVRKLGAGPALALELAVTPDRARWPAGVPRSPQGGGDLGQRMRRALFRHRRAVLVGSDIPGLGPADVAPPSAPSAGPMRCSARPRMAATGWSASARAGRSGPSPAVRWSGEHALADTLANFRRHRVALLRRLRDVDTMKDLLAARGRMP